MLQGAVASVQATLAVFTVPAAVAPGEVIHVIVRQ
jgi:hypothetical protein